MSVSMSPRKIEMIAGGASLAPSRWSLPALAMLARSSPCQLVDRADHRGAEHQELHVVVRVRARREQVVALVVAHRPVQVLARAVDAGKRLLVQQARQPELRRRSASASPSSSSDDRWRRWRSRRSARSRTGSAPPRCAASSPARRPCTARLSTSVMNAMHALGNRAEVLIFELLALRRLGAEQRPAGVDQIGPRQVEVADRSGSIPARGRRS